MKKVMSEEKRAQRPDLIEYDREHPSSHFSSEWVRYIESRQIGLSERDHQRLDQIEFFILNLNHGGLISCAIPGLREVPSIEVRYVKRFSTIGYWRMINEFFEYIPPDFPQDQVGRCNMPAFRLTLPDGAQFYPVQYNGDFLAWRKRLDDSAAFFKTLIGRFENGKFVVSDGRQLEFADMDVEWVGEGKYPSDF